MWHTNNGDRTLEDAEARLFAEALWSFVCELEMDEGDYDVGLEVFDRLTYGQKVYLLSIVGAGLLKPDEPICKLTAVVEGAIAAVFEHLKTAVMLEIDEPEIKSNWRKMILAARREVGAEELPKKNCKDEQEWLFEIEALSYMILWDADYENAGLYIDSPPEESRWLKDMSGVSDSYFLAIADDLSEEQAKTKIREFQKLCQSIEGVQ